MPKTYNPETRKFDLEVVSKVDVSEVDVSEVDGSEVEENTEDFIPYDERPKKHRGWVATIWNVENTHEFYEDIVQRQVNGVTYIAYGLERCPKTDRPHHQAFFYTKIQRGTGKASLKKLGSMWGPKHCYVKMMRGNFAQNRAYCEKAGEYREVGVKPRMGARLDLDEMKDSIMEGTQTAESILLDDPMQYHMYGRTIERLQTIANRATQRDWMTRGYWLWGEPGCGKSHHAALGETCGTHYRFPDDGRWWDDYVGQEIVIIDDFRPEQIKFSQLLRLLDKYPMTVPRRNKAPTPFLAKTVIITCVRPPRFCFGDIDEDIRQLLRRLDVIQITKGFPINPPWLNQPSP